MNTSAKNIDEYIQIFPQDIQKILEEIRETIKKTAPEATEKISYGMPTFYLEGNLVHFAAYDHHIGFYATPTGHEKFQKELSQYKSGKGSVQFPIEKPMPFDLIREIVKFRVEENKERAKEKKLNKKV